LKLQKKLELNYIELSNMYISIFKERKIEQSYKVLYFSLFMHKKLHYYSFFVKKKLKTFSNGQILYKRTKITKFFKKSRKSFGASINLLNKKLKRNLNKIFFFYCKNFNYKNYLWLKKFFYLLEPTINFAIFTRGWSYVHKYRRRIKKKILRNLLKSNLKI